MGPNDSERGGPANRRSGAAGPMGVASLLTDRRLTLAGFWLSLAALVVLWWQVDPSLVPWGLALAGLTTLSAAVVLRWLRRSRDRDRRRAEKSEAKYRIITEGSGDLITEHEAGTGVILYASAAARSLGFEPEELVGRSMGEVMPEEDRRRVQADLDHLTETGRPVTMTHRIVNPAGEVRWVEATAQRVTAHYPNIVAVIRDVTERKEVEEEREELRRRLMRSASAWRDTFDAMESPIVVVDEEGSLRRVNKAAATLAGMHPSDLVGTSTSELEHPFWRLFEDLAEQAKEGARPARGSFREQAPDRTSSPRHWSVVVHPGISLVSESKWLVGTASDVTHLMELRESLRRRKALASLGTLFANIAHEVRNPLFSLAGLLEAVRRRFSRVEGLDEYLSTLLHEVERLRKIMLGLLDYGRPAPLQRSRQEPGSLAREALGSLREQASEASVELELVSEGDLPEVSVDRVRFVEVLVNALDNAIHHSREGQRITLLLERQRRDGREHVRFLVRDRGPGFAEEDLERIFEPFFSRRAGGTGLGLPIVQRLVELHDGQVQVRNAEGGGAEVDIQLPVSPPDGAAGERGEAPGEGSTEDRGRPAERVGKET